MTHLPIRLLRLLGYEGAEETVCAAHYRGALLAPLRKGSCQRQLTEGSFFVPALALLPIRLLRQHGYEAAEKTVTSGRPMVAPTFSSEVQSTP